jgi:hypothetical protein
MGHSLVAALELEWLLLWRTPRNTADMVPLRAASWIGTVDMVDLSRFCSVFILDNSDRIYVFAEFALDQNINGKVAWVLR